MKLFGGAIIAEIPSSLIDASDIREVPDNQEVYVGAMQEFNVSLIIELLEPVRRPTLTESLAYHVEEAHRLSNVHKDDREELIEVLSERLGGREAEIRIDIVKPKKGGPVMLTFGLFRLEEYETDVLVTASLSQENPSEPVYKEVDSQVTGVKNVIESFKIVDPQLFATETDHMDKSEGRLHDGADY